MQWVLFPLAAVGVLVDDPETLPANSWELGVDGRVGSNVSLRGSASGGEQVSTIITWWWQ